MKVRQFDEAMEKGIAPGIRIRSLARSIRKTGAAVCTNIWTITCGNSARELPL